MKFILLLSTYLISLIMPANVISGEPPVTPFIAINAEMHTAGVNNIATDREEKLLATVSNDKTLKLWERKTGKLLKTIRPPIGSGSEGYLNAVALSPDGKTVVAGGHTGSTWDGNYSVYFYDVATGAMQSRMGGYEKFVQRITYSKDGSRLAIGLGDGGGISVHSSVNHKRLFSDNKFVNDISALGFDTNGKLVAMSNGGDIKGFSEGGLSLYSIRAEKGKNISSASISPDNSMLVVGYKDHNTIEVRNAADGALAFELNDPVGRPWSKGRFSAVAWSVDGSQVLAAGIRYLNESDRNKLIVSWSVKSQRVIERIALPVNENIGYLLPFQDGQLLFSPSHNAFGLVDNLGREVYYKNLQRADFFKGRQVFRVNSDATSVMFGFERDGNVRASFDFKKRRINTVNPEADDFLPPRYTAEGIDVQNWDFSAAPRLGKNKIKGLMHDEISCALTVRHDDQGFFLGTNMALRSYNKTGTLNWMQKTNSSLWSITLSENDKTLIVAHGDGTIRYYHADSGEEIAAFYPHPDRKRWILWLPSGFFDHGPDSESLIGFHVNRGSDKEAMLVSVNQMYDTFYRPDIIDQAIVGKDISAYLKNLAKPSGGSVAALQKEVEEKERLAREKAELERIAKQKTEAETLETERKAAEQLAAKKLEEQRIAKEKNEQENLARQKAETERLAALKVEQGRLEKLRLEIEQARLAKIKSEASRKAEEERLALQKAEAERKAKLKAQQELISRQNAEQELIARQKAEEYRLEAERKEAEQLAVNKREQQRIAKEKAEQESLARQKNEAELKARLAAENDRAKQLMGSTAEAANLMGTLVNAATMPPTVHFITTSGEAKQHDIELLAELCDKGGGIGDVTLFLNDMPIAIENISRGLKVQQKAAKNCYSFERTISLQNGRNEITLMATNKDNSIESERRKIELVLTSAAVEKPHLHIFTIAVNRYRDGDLQLKYAINDADVLARVSAEKANTLFAGVHVHKLHNEDVTKEKLEASFTAIGKQTKRDDVFILFVAGHGITGERDGAYYFLPVNFRYTGEESIANQGVSMNDFKKYLTNIQATKSLLLIDTCNSGSFSEAIASRGVTEKTAMTKLARAMGRATIAASSKSQVALEGYEGHGVFSFTVLEGLRGKASNKKGEITVNLLANFIEETLPEITYKKWGYEQVPQKTLQGMDFPIGMR